jgi:hypothetical protein
VVSQLSRLPLTRILVEVAVHTILYVREVYPADVFVRRKKFGTPVFQARHPGLNAYVAGAIRAVREELLRVSPSSKLRHNRRNDARRAPWTRSLLSSKTEWTRRSSASSSLSGK